MSLLQGSLSFKRLMVLGPAPSPEALAQGMHDDRFTPFQDGSEEERLGWCDWRNPLSPVDPNWIMQEQYAVLGLRIDTRKVPASTLKAHVDMRIHSLMKEKDLAFVGKEARLAIADEVKAELLPKVLPTMKTFEVAWSYKEGVIFTTATSTKAFGTLAGLVLKSFGLELQPMAPLLIAGKVCPAIPTDGLMALDPLDLGVEDE